MRAEFDGPTFTRAATIAATSSSNHEIDLVWTTGAAVRRYDRGTGEPFDEVLDLSPSSVRLQRLNNGAPLLDMHASGSLERIIGVVVPGSVRLTATEGRASVRLSKRKELAGIVQDIRDGIIRNISVGYRVHKVEKTAASAGQVAQYRAVDWEPVEVSMVAVPADPGARVRTDLQPNFSTETAAHVCINPPGPQLDQKSSSNMNFPTVRLGIEDHEKRGAAIVDAILHRADPGQFPATPAAREFAGLSLVSMARDFLEAQGVNVRGLSKMEIATRALDPNAFLRDGGSMATGDFPSILANVLNKQLRAGYAYAPPTWRPFTRVVPAPDFKKMSRVLLSEAPALEQVAEGSEYPRGGMSDAAESYAIATYGKIISITRQTIINDDIDAFARLPRAMGIQAAQLESDLVWSQILANPVLNQDGVALFDPAHRNVAASGSGINVVAVGAGRAAMENQTGLDGSTVLAAEPKFLIVPKAMQTQAEQFVGRIRPQIAAAVVPESMRKLEIICEARLDNGIAGKNGVPAIAGSPTTWYLASEPGLVDTVELAYLDGDEGVFTETKMGFDIDGMDVKVRMDVGAKVIDFRGLFKNAGQ